MNNILKAGVVIGVLCGLWTYVIGFTGWYKDPVLLNLFWLVFLIEIVILVWGLRKTASEGRTYWQQVGAGTLMSVVGGVIIIGSSILFTTVVFPNYNEDIRVLGEQMMRSEGKSEEEIRMALEDTVAGQTPLRQAMIGFVSTVVTGLISSLIIGAFMKKKEQTA